MNLKIKYTLYSREGKEIESKTRKLKNRVSKEEAINYLKKLLIKKYPNYYQLNIHHLIYLK